MNKLKAKNVPIYTVKDSQQKEMFNLFSRYYENTKYDKFISDLENKDRVILLLDKDDLAIRGFSTIKELKFKRKNKEFIGIFSGDTIIDANYWGQTALTMAFFKHLLKTRLKNPFKNTYWFLISKGYKTYLLLTNNFHNFYPRFDKETPLKENTILDDFGKKLFGELYDEKLKIIKCPEIYDRLKKSVAPITKETLEKNPHIAFFQEKNPNWIKGEELCCIGKVDVALIIKYLTRYILKKIKKRKYLKWKLNE